jgi:hypothetical protein
MTPRCTGKRDRTAFVKVGDMSNATLSNDYHFLDDVIGKIDANQRFLRQSGGVGGGTAAGKHPSSSSNKRSRQHQSSWKIHTEEEPGAGGGEAQQHALLQAARKDRIAPKRLTLPSTMEEQQSHDTSILVEEMAPPAAAAPTTAAANDHQEQSAERHRRDAAAAAAQDRQAGLSNLQNHARHRGVTMLRLPSFMERHKRNETCIRNKMIYWTVEWRLYPDHDADDQHDKHNSLGAVKTTTVAQTCETTVLFDELRRLLQLENADAQLLACHHSLLLKHELSPANAPKYSMVASSSATLADALTDQTIIEFPTVHVVPPTKLKDFPLLIQSINANDEIKE